MHKLAKGLKKKKKPKKGKKGAEEDEFDPEELERYRRERAEAQEKAAAASAEGGGQAGQEGQNSCEASSGGAGSDEWQKFQALTAGVDSILKKTQGDLDRIKSTSFFQRKAPVEDQKHKKQKEAEAVEEAARSKARRWVGFDKDGNPIESEQQENGEEEERGSEGGKKKTDKDGKSSLGVSEEGFVDVPEDDDEEDDSAEEDIFDTTYVDVLQNIDVQLAYIPDSPTEEEIGDDPFDTSNADKVLKTVDKKGNKLVSLGNAVEVLSGRIDHVSTCKISRPRKAPRTQDLLLDDDFDESEISVAGESSFRSEESFTVQKTLLDDDSDLPDVPIDLTKLPPVISKPVEATLPNGHHAETKVAPLDISEFEILNKEKSLLEEIPDLDDAEFDLGTIVDETCCRLEEAEDPFGARETDQVNFEAEIIEASFEAASFVNEEDPFDTTFAENILPGKTELKFIEKELEELPTSSAEVSISLTDPAGLRRDYETGLLSSDPSNESNIARQSLITAKQDLLDGSCTDLARLNEKPIEPAEEITYVDPFDTSSIRELLPGQTELKFLEQELLGGEEGKVVGKSLDDDDDDFDPRKEEVKVPAVAQPPPRPSQQPKPNFQVNFDVDQTLDDVREEDVIAEPRGRKASRPEILGLGTVNKTVNFELPTPSKRPDLLQTSDEEKSIASTKPLTPYYSQKSLEDALPEVSESIEEIEVDPFDTSFVGKVAPGKTELKLIESELLTKQEPTSRLSHSISDHDFDPRSAIENPPEPERARRRSDFGTGPINRLKNLRATEAAASLIEEYEVSSRPDVFQINEAAHRRGTSENRRQESLLDAEVEVDAKPLTPRVESRSNIGERIDEITYVDPFDTSIATNILPGRAELKLLENELRELPTEVQRVRVNAIDLDRVSARPVASINHEDDDFDPRAGEPTIKESTDFLSLDEQQDPGDKVLTPLNKREFFIDEDVDPFDTSFASIGPGKTELKLLESELMDK